MFFFFQDRAAHESGPPPGLVASVSQPHRRSRQDHR